MAKPNLRKLNPIEFIKMAPTREKIIANASSAPVPDAREYKPNQLSAALHPPVQHLVVTKVTHQCKDVKSYHLAPDPQRGTTALAWHSAGQYISVRLTVGGMELTRPYSLASSPREALAGEYMLTVKGVPGGLASQFILDNWQVGTQVTASAPLGVFTYEPLRDAKTVIGIAGGSGITPFHSLAKAIADGDEDASLVLLYGSRTLEDAIFQQELKALEGAKFKLVNVLSHDTRDGCEQGFITADLIKKYAPEGEYSLFLCGPQAMYDFVDKEIETLQLRRKFIRHELFGEYFGPSKEPDYPQNVPNAFQVTVRQAGNVYTVTAYAEESLLRTFEKNGIAAPAHCRSGECGWCHSRLVSGEIYTPKHMDGRREADRIYGYIHPCCSFPLSDLVVEVPPVGK